MTGKNLEAKAIPIVGELFDIFEDGKVTKEEWKKLAIVIVRITLYVVLIWKGIPLL